MNLISEIKAEAKRAKRIYGEKDKDKTKNEWINLIHEYVRKADNLNTRNRLIQVAALIINAIESNVCNSNETSNEINYENDYEEDDDRPF